MNNVQMLINNIPYITPAQVASMGECRVATVRDWLHNHKLKAIRVRGQYYIKLEDANRFLEFNKKAWDLRNQMSLLRKEYAQPTVTRDDF